MTFCAFPTSSLQHGTLVSLIWFVTYTEAPLVIENQFQGLHFYAVSRRDVGFSSCLLGLSEQAPNRLDILLCMSIRLIVVRRAGNMKHSHLFHILPFNSTCSKAKTTVRNKGVRPSVFGKNGMNMVCDMLDSHPVQLVNYLKPGLLIHQ